MATQVKVIRVGVGLKKKFCIVSSHHPRWLLTCFLAVKKLVIFIGAVDAAVDDDDNVLTSFNGIDVEPIGLVLMWRSWSSATILTRQFWRIENIV